MDRCWTGSLSCSQLGEGEVGEGTMADHRGNAWEHDPGPSDASGWADVFAETPNYRGLGRAVVGREAFRWHHGPMFFRGRLDGSAKVGIFGQYTTDLRPLAQDPRSPIVKHRNRILDKAVVDGDARLVIAVGLAAKESVATWIKAHGGTAQSDQLHTALLGSLPNRVRVVGVVHPGSAATGSTGPIKADFIRAIGHIRDWINADPAWLPTDPGMTRNLSATFPYSSAPIPFPHFPF